MQISKSRTESARRIERAKMILAYAEGATVSTIARQLSTNRSKVERLIDKALQLGALTALDVLTAVSVTEIRSAYANFPLSENVRDSDV